MIARIAILLVALTLATEAQYVTGPRGGCYTVSASGRKRYVDRSLCSSSSPPARSVPALPRNDPPAALAATSPAAQTISDFETARRLLEWFKSPAATPSDQATKADLARRLGLTAALPK